MKRKLYTLLIGSLLAASLTVSCKKDGEVENPSEFNPDGSANVRVDDTMHVDGADGNHSHGEGSDGSHTHGGAGTDGNGSSAGGINSSSTGGNNSGTTGSNLSTSVNKQNAKEQGGTTERDKRAGSYSAPDGTDAENSDGDYYTKNDKQQLPTGSIK